MKKKITIALGILIILTIIGVVAVSVYRSSESYRHKKASESTNKKMEICIDNIFYTNTGIQVPIEPDESAIEYVEIPVGGDVAISAFARINDSGENYLVCLIGEEWYKFIAE